MQTTPRNAETTGDVIDLLRAQHGRIRDLFDEVMGSDGDERRKSFQELVKLLAIHETAEEEIIHPVARRLPGGDGIVDERLAEERQAKELLSELDGMDVDDPRFMKSLDKLRMDVLTHARAAEATAPTHPHPGTETATRNMLAGPLVAMVDRVRDMIRDARDR